MDKQYEDKTPREIPTHKNPYENNPLKDPSKPSDNNPINPQSDEPGNPKKDH
jgi:hypothetical protein